MLELFMFFSLLNIFAGDGMTDTARPLPLPEINVEQFFEIIPNDAASLLSRNLMHSSDVSTYERGGGKINSYHRFIEINGARLADNPPADKTYWAEYPTGWAAAQKRVPTQYIIWLCMILHNKMVSCFDHEFQEILGRANKEHPTFKAFQEYTQKIIENPWLQISEERQKSITKIVLGCGRCSGEIRAKMIRHGMCAGHENEPDTTLVIDRAPILPDMICSFNNLDMFGCRRFLEGIPDGSLEEIADETALLRNSKVMTEQFKKKLKPTGVLSSIF